ncbi:ABC-2 family transporter protein [Streptococcus pneumoniae]|uniref:ABC transporter permease n=1 Tax=Streptococcus pneumoniae TaxID=1313 RepID=UPI0007669728|nr:ABC transporter permease [Streptococcus pneumoniae]CVY91240.1 ABC-2 family transporter protein [Streptococcus pneumoniae]CWG32193.1 ABC-2 family transporter protein [Streptococcus pneumoniae]
MKLNKFNFLKENIRNLYSSGVIYLSLLISFIPPILLTFFILKTQGISLGIKHISNFYAMLGMLMAVIHANRVISRDFSHNTVSLFYNQQKNRMIYVLSNFLYAISVSIIYALNGIVLLVIVSKLGIPGDLGLDFIVAIVVNTILLVLFYFLLSYIFYLYKLKSGLVFGILVALLLFIPNILNTMMNTSNDLFIKAIELLPFYSLPVFVASNTMSISQYLVLITTIILLYFFTLKKSKKYSF